MQPQVRLDGSMLLTVSLNQMRNDLPGIALAAVAADDVVRMHRIPVHRGSVVGIFHKGYLQNHDAKLYEKKYYTIFCYINRLCIADYAFSKA